MKTILSLILLAASTAFANPNTPITLDSEGVVSLVANNLDGCTQTGKGAPIECTPQLKGKLMIEGKAAEDLFANMNAVVTHPEAPDLENKLSNDHFTLIDLEFKRGSSIFCYKWPQKSNSGSSTRKAVCEITLLDLSSGKIK